MNERPSATFKNHSSARPRSRIVRSRAKIVIQGNVLRACFACPIEQSALDRRELRSSVRTSRDRCANTKSQKDEMSGVGFLSAVKTFAPGSRRRRRFEKQQKVLELPPGYTMQPDVVPCWDSAPPITPPAAFLPPGYKKVFPGEPIFSSNVDPWRFSRFLRDRFRGSVGSVSVVADFSRTSSDVLSGQFQRFDY